jgi:hypothetical protein
MLQFMSSQSAAIKEAEDLKERLKSFDRRQPGAPDRSALIRPSKWANRHDMSFETTDFAELKAEIESAGGNVQPVRVRRWRRVERFNRAAVRDRVRASPTPSLLGTGYSGARWWRMRPTRSCSRRWSGKTVVART